MTTSAPPLIDVEHLYDTAPLSRPLRRRLALTLGRLQAQPQASLPTALGPAGYTGMLRLMHHAAVTSDALLTPVLATTHREAKDVPAVLAIHDTTENAFGGKARRAGLGPLRAGGQGFFFHACLLVTDDAVHRPLGIAAAETWVRPYNPPPKPRGPRWRPATNDTESARWSRQMGHVQEAVADATHTVIHVADRESDDYALLADAQDGGWRFVFRMSHDRRIVPDPALPQAPTKVRACLEERLEGCCERWVWLSERTTRTPHARKIHPSRRGRAARLVFDATTVTLVRPENQPLHLAATVTVNVVRVWEPEPPPGEVAVEWILYTSEPVTTVAQVLRVVDAYRARWLVEEFFKALKTGCTYQNCQAETYATLQKLLWLHVPIAVHLLRLRDAAEQTPEATATPQNTGLSAEALAVLDADRPAPTSRLTVVGALLAIARLGGHLRHNGEPGWLVLTRGMQVLLQRVEGWRLANQHSSPTIPLPPKTDRS